MESRFFVGDGAEATTISSPCSADLPVLVEVAVPYYEVSHYVYCVYLDRGLREHDKRFLFPLDYFGAL